MGLFDDLKNLFKPAKQPAADVPKVAEAGADPAPQIAPKTHNHKVAGVTHYESNILQLAVKNPAYALSDKEIIARRLHNTNIYEYTFPENNAELQPDPTNPHDPNAIKVVIGGQLVGYIKAGSCSRILKLIEEDRIAKIECTIGGGKFRNVWSDGRTIQQSEKGRKNYGIQITIIEK